MSHGFSYFERLRGRAPAALVCLALWSTGCSNTATTSVGPSPTKCEVAAAGPTEPIGAGGGTASITISAQPECAWTAVAEGAWISGLTPAGGQGPGKVQFGAAANPSGAARSAHIVLNDQKVVVQQRGAECSIGVPRTSEVSAQGGTGSFPVTTLAGCPWTAASGSSWLTITSATSGTGPGTVSYSADANPGPTRTGTLSVAGQTVSVEQPAFGTPPPPPACQAAVNPAVINAPVGGSQASVSVTAQAGCAWTVVPGASWIVITSAERSGTAPVRFSIGPNDGAARTATVMVAGQAVTVNQAGGTAPPGCDAAVSPAVINAPVGGSEASVSVTAQAGCAWTVVPGASWIVITSVERSGTAPVRFSIGPNDGAARTATVMVAGQAVTVNQAGACTLSLSSRAQSMAAMGGTFTVSVSTAAGCSWNAVSQSGWLTVTSGASGSGSGSLTIAVDPNTGLERTGVVNVGPDAITVTQAAGCSYDIAPTSQTFTPAGGSGGPVTVTAPAGCAWTATSSASWVAIGSGSSGTGTGTVTFSVAANTGAPRAADLTIAGRTFRVSQDGTCSFTVSPLLLDDQPPAGGPAPVISVTAPALCSWTATSNTSWITITGGASGSGDGTVTITLATNTSGPRTGSLTVAGSTVTVKQLKKD